MCTDCEMNYRASRNKRLLVELTIIQLSQINSENADDYSGRSPKQLKPIFNKIATSESGTTSAPQQMPAPAAPAAIAVAAQSTVAQSTATDTAQAAAPAKAGAAAPAPQQPAVLSGRPDSLKRTSGSGDTPFGGMFRRTHNNLSQEKSTEESQQPEKSTAATETIVKKLTGDQLSQKWMEYALRLPENERALADRMKIIVPELTGDNQFTIKVGNKLVMDFFAKEAKSITKYIEETTGCQSVAMKIDIDEQQTRRRIYDRTEQFKLLTEKNPALEKLRKSMNLDFA